jgi:hypothetical protein
VNEARRLRQLEDENGRLKKIVAQEALDLDALKVVLSKSAEALKKRLPPIAYRNAIARPARATPNQHISDREAASLSKPELCPLLDAIALVCSVK